MTTFSEPPWRKDTSTMIYGKPSTADPNVQVAQVKEKIAQEKGWEATQQKLIYSGNAMFVSDTCAMLTLMAYEGKILQDQNTVESYNIEEKGFIVCMVSKVGGHCRYHGSLAAKASTA